MSEELNIKENNNTNQNSISGSKPKSFYRQSVFIVILILAICAAGGRVYYNHLTKPETILAKKGIPYTEEGFFKAIESNDLEAVKLFLEKNAYSFWDENKITGKPSLHIAIGTNNPEMVKLFISGELFFHDQTDAQGNNTLDIALKQGNEQIIKMLMDRIKVKIENTSVKSLALDTKESVNRSINKALREGTINETTLSKLGIAYTPPPPPQQTASAYSPSSYPAPEPVKQQPQLIIVDGWTVQDMGHPTKPYKKIIGSVKNVGNINIGYFKLIAEFLDRNGNVLDTNAAAERSTIRPGDQKKFEIIHEINPSTTRVRLFIEEVVAK